MNMQWNIDLTAPPLKSKTMQSGIKQECYPGDRENEKFSDDDGGEDEEGGDDDAIDCEQCEDDDEFGCTMSANKISSTFHSGSDNEKFLIEMELAAMVQSFALDQSLFFDKFGQAFGKLGHVGYAIEGQTEDKEPKYMRLGTLKAVDLLSCEL